ncbi:molybdenum ABC transporter ATP-binding protein [uncultured Cohaesibacter sp.]|uniref:molybdenum ABC transporter ATP-binding protein n=1 Tax=uncultured Cohaesibacter sp. TaxID=1002546 RepID=UPI0029C825E8|nr:molybdenum ABC transporter ATP-binding protein [uncultured Cohaesibacter sp.]
MNQLQATNATNALRTGSGSDSASDRDVIAAHFKGMQGSFELDAAFELSASGVTALFGPSGCGKTSILRCIAGLNRLPFGHFSLKGEIWQDDSRFLPAHKRPVGYVFQEASLFPHMSVEQNLVYGQKRAHRLDGQQGPQLNQREVTDLLGIGPLLKRSTTRLSGGERQRVAIGRALLSHPRILLMDEPMAALDRFSKNEILPYLERLHDELNIPVLYVSHDIAEVERLADQMVLMENGGVKAAGPLQALLSDPALSLSHMPQAASVLAGNLVAIDSEFGISTITVADIPFQVPGVKGPLGRPVRLRIEASDVALSRHVPEGSSSILNTPPVTIETIQPFGQHMANIFLRLGDGPHSQTLIARISRKSQHALDLKPGERIQAMVKSVSMVREV